MRLSTPGVAGVCSCSQDECRAACSLLFVYSKELDRSLQILCFYICNNSAFQFSVLSKIVTCIHAYQNSKFLAAVCRTYFRLMRSMPRTVFCGLLLQMHSTYGMRWEKAIQTETRCCCSWSRSVLRSTDARWTTPAMLVHSSIRTLQMQRLSIQHFSLLWENPQFLYV